MIEDFRNKEQLRQQLISMGIGKEMLQHKAFNVLLDEIRSHSGPLSNIHINSDTCSFTKKDNRITFKSFGDPTLLTGYLEINKDSITLFYSDNSKDQPYRDQTEFTAIITPDGFLKFETVGRMYSKNPGEREQLESTSVTRRTFHANGIEIAKEFQFRPRSSRGQHIEFHRDGIDLAWVYQKNDDTLEESSGFTVLSNEYGLQQMRVMPTTSINNYIWDYIPPLTEEEYEEIITKGNSPEIQEALREYNMQERLAKSGKKR